MAKPSLLVVDDDKNTLDGLVRILQYDGYPVSGVLSGCGALKLLSNNKFDVIITDMNMPGMDGLTLVQEIRKRKEPVAIVIVTANNFVKAFVDTVKNVAYDYYLTKPVNVAELRTVLEKL